MYIEDYIYEKTCTPNHFSNPKNRDIWCIGDVHGCIEQYKDLVDQIRRKDNDAVIIQLGDLIDRGLADLYELFVFNDHQMITNCLGNHEFNFLIEHFRGKSCRSKARVNTHDQFNSYDTLKQRYILEQMLSMKNFITVDVDGQTWTLSHAPIRQGFVESFDCGSASVYCMSTTHYEDDEIIRAVHGHMHWDYQPIEQQLKSNRNWYNVDSGCVYGEYLTALSLKTLDYIQIPGTKYAEHERF